MGAPESWPVPLRTSVSLMLDSPGPTWIAWGAEQTFFYNDAYQPLLGRKHPSALGLPFKVVWAEIWSDLEPLMAQAVAGEPVIMRDLPLSVVRGAGAEDAYFTFSFTPLRDEKGIIHGLFCHVNETTAGVLAEQRRDAAEAALYAMNASLEKQVAQRIAELRLYHDIIQTNAEPICAFDTELRLIAINHAHSDEFYRIYGCRVGVGQILSEHMPFDQAILMRESMTKALSGESFTVSQKLDASKPSNPCWEIVYTPLLDEHGRVVAAFYYAKDISVRLRAEAELATTQGALRQSQKMEAIGQLTGGLAHDFNNLLGSISGSLELMSNRINRERIHGIEKYVTIAQGAAKRAAALTHRLLAFSRRQTLAPKATNVNDLTSGMLDLVQRTVGPNIEIHQVEGLDLWTTLVDPSQLESALLNLCINARDAMRNGGCITIETKNCWVDEFVAKQLNVPKGQYVSLCVSDTGAGMTSDVIDKAFDPFFTTKPIGQGTGLGLSMIYGFARQSGGQTKIRSEVGRGTEVCIYLPRHLGAVGALELEPNLATAVRAEDGQTVLVVDDEGPLRMLMVELLEELGYRVIEAADGVVGLRMLDSKMRVDLLVADMGLPGGMNGRQMADAARMARPELKVLFITGHAESAVPGHGYLDLGFHVLAKPFPMEVLANRIKKIIDASTT